MFATQTTIPNTTRSTRMISSLFALLLTFTLTACGGCDKSPVAPIGDTSAPTVVSTSPTTGSAGVQVTTIITATFSEEIDSDTANASTFTLSGPNGRVAGDVSGGGSSVTFVPSSSLEDATTYTATLTTGIEDAARNALASPYSWSFTTAGGGDDKAPLVQSTSPISGAKDVSIGTTINVTFSETIDPATVNTSTFTILGPNGPVGGNANVNGSIATFTPGSALVAAATYTATLSTDIADNAGNRLVNSFSWTFMTAEAADTTPPTVESTTPTAGATNIATSTLLTAAFSEEIDAGSVNNATFTLTGPNGQVVGNVTASGSSATFAPTTTLAQATTYTATLTTGIRDTAGNPLSRNVTWTFMTAEAADTTPPTVESTTPTAGATNVATGTFLTAAFSENIDAGSVNNATFTLTGPNGQVVGNVTASGSSATFAPTTTLAQATTYTATLTTGIRDTAGNPLSRNVTWTFMTAGSTDQTAPVVQTNSPATGAENVPTTTTITATFSEDLDTSTVNGASFTLSGPAGQITGDVGASGSTVTFGPRSPLSASTTYTATLTTGIKDLAGNALTDNFTWRFTTASSDQTAPTLFDVEPSPDKFDVPVDNYIGALFNESLDPSSVTAASFTLVGPGGVVNGTVLLKTQNVSNDIVAFRPFRELSGDAVYTATLSSNIKDGAGNNFGGYSWSFRTKATQPAPTVTHVDPSKVDVSGGTDVHVYGTNFVQLPTVTFDGVPALVVSYLSSTELLVTVPAHFEGFVDVVVTNPDGQSGMLVDGLEYVRPVFLEKSNWQVDLTYGGGSFRVEVEMDQDGESISGFYRDNNREVNVTATGSIVGDTIHVRFVMENGNNPRGEFTCTGTIFFGSEQTISGTFTSPDGSYLGGPSGMLMGSFSMR